MDSSTLQALQNASSKYGVPLNILYPIVMSESGGNPLAHTVTDKEDSRGLFQVNIYAHPQANSGQLFNAEYNADYQVRELANYYQEGKAKGLKGADLSAYVERYGQRPAWNTTVENNIRKYYAEFTGTDITKATENNVSSVGDLMGSTSISSIKSDVSNGVKFYGMYSVLFIVLLFSLYIVFVNKGGK